MIVVPVPWVLSAIRHGSSHNLWSRAADVCLKERRPWSLYPGKRLTTRFIWKT
ncbi:MAG: flavoprotein [Enterocloster bolteae]